MYLYLNVNNQYQGMGSISSGGILITDAQYKSIETYVLANLEAFKYHCIIVDPITFACSVDVALLSQLQLVEARKAKENEIRQDCAHAIDIIATPYPQQERDTWFKQATEAEAWMANNTTITPMLDAMLAARQVNDPTATKLGIVNNILAKRDLFNAAVGAQIGKQQGLLAQVYATNATKASVQAILW